MGTVVSVTKDAALTLWDGTIGTGFVIVVKADVVLQGATLGCSIAVNGTCLTVTEWDDKTFTVNCAPETLRLTNLGELKPGDKVNCERSLASDGRNSGHYVQGHVDGMGTLKEFRREGDSLWVTISAPKELLQGIVPKGYVAVDGTSLTVCEVNFEEGWFNLMLIAFTQKHIIMPLKSVGDHVNLEVDVIAKYVENSISGLQSRVADLEDKLTQSQNGARLNATVTGLLFASIVTAAVFKLVHSRS